MARGAPPNIITVFSSQQIGSEVGLAMEYIKGPDAGGAGRGRRATQRRRSDADRLALCDALAAVHKLGLVHRDLKASNVMRQHGGHIVLMDFGAGREMGRRGRPRQILGTPVYMPPEMLLGSSGTPQSDIYSLGVLLYNLVTGEYPVRGRGIEQLRLAHLSDNRFSLSERRTRAPAAVCEVRRAARSRRIRQPPVERGGVQATCSPTRCRMSRRDRHGSGATDARTRWRHRRRWPCALPSGPTTTSEPAVSWQPVVLGGLDAVRSALRLRVSDEHGLQRQRWSGPAAMPRRACGPTRSSACGTVRAVSAHHPVRDHRLQRHRRNPSPGAACGAAARWRDGAGPGPRRGLDCTRPGWASQVPCRNCSRLSAPWRWQRRSGHTSICCTR